jgi:hypothetical protein
MKIGILGNMNNMYFSLARYLADEGYDCELLVFDYEPDHFHPTADTFKSELNFAIRQLNWGDYGRFFIRPEQIKSDLAPYEFLIGNGTAPAFVNRIGRKLDLFIPYGGDLYAFPFLRCVFGNHTTCFSSPSDLIKRRVATTSRPYSNNNNFAFTCGFF